MLTVLRDTDNHLQAACDWWLVDEQGVWTPTGRYVYLNQLETEGLWTPSLTRRLILSIARLVPWTLGVYWDRRDKVTRPHGFTRVQVLRFANRRQEVHA